MESESGNTEDLEKGGMRYETGHEGGEWNNTRPSYSSAELGQLLS